MSILVEYDVITSRVKSVVPAPDPSVFAGRSDVLYFTDRTAVHEDVIRLLAAANPIKYLKIVDESVDVMTAQEQAAVDAEEAAAHDAQVRSDAKARLSGFASDPLMLRALADSIKDEFNVLRQRDRDRATDVAAATTLADLKTRWAARASLEDRTLDQIKTAIEDRIDSRLIDSSAAKVTQ